MFVLLFLFVMFPSLLSSFILSYSLCQLKNCTGFAFIFQGISDDIPVVKAIVPKNQMRSFITQGSSETLVSFFL